MENFSDLTAAILAGGLGRRLRAVVPDQPKVLVKVHGRPFLQYILEQIAHLKIGKVVLCTGYLGERIEACFHDSYKNLRLVYSREAFPLGTGGALRLALPLFGSGTVIVLNGDSYCNVDLVSFWEWHCAQKAEASILLVEQADTRRYGRIETDGTGRVINFEEKNQQGGKGWINGGIYLLTNQFLQSIPERKVVSLERETFPSWIGSGLYGYKTLGRFLDIGTPESYRVAAEFFDEDIQKWVNADS